MTGGIYDLKVLSKCFFHLVQKLITEHTITTTKRIRKELLSWKSHIFTMGQNRKNHRINTHLITHFPMSEEESKVSERASK